MFLKQQSRLEREGQQNSNILITTVELIQTINAKVTKGRKDKCQINCMFNSHSRTADDGGQAMHL